MKKAGLAKRFDSAPAHVGRVTATTEGAEMIPRGHTDWAEIIRTAESPERQWTLFTVLADRLALTTDMAPGQSFSFYEGENDVQLLFSWAICHSTPN